VADLPAKITGKVTDLPGDDKALRVRKSPPAPTR
jgi:hypothetical protein